MDIFKNNKGARISGFYTSLNNINLISYWYTFLEENNLDYDIPSRKPKKIEDAAFDKKPEDIPKKLII